MSDELLRLAKARALRAFPSAEVVEPAVKRYRALVGPPPDELVPAALRALEELKKGKRPQSDDLEALEIAIRMQRPSTLCRGSTIDDFAEAETKAAFPDWPQFRERAAKLLLAVGRIARREDTESYSGTGFHVGGGLLVTNHHVVTHLSRGADVLAPGRALVDFEEENGTFKKRQPSVVREIVAIHDTLDLALLRVDNAPDASIPVQGSDASAGDRVVAIGHPAKDSERNPLFVDSMFQNIYGVKRAAPGEVVRTRGPELRHDCTTLGGNSGSPVLSMKNGSLVGVHAEGAFLYRNGAVAVSALQAFIAAQAR